MKKVFTLHTRVYYRKGIIVNVGTRCGRAAGITAVYRPTEIILLSLNNENSFSAKGENDDDAAAIQ